MGIKDVLNKVLIEDLNTVYSTRDILMMLLKCFVIAMCIYLVYRFQARDSFFSGNFAISLVGVSLVTAAIIITIQYSLVVSLGMVGALSIVRFRTAIKDPLDLLYLFWSISVGIICGAGMTRLAILLSLILVIVILGLGNIPTLKAPMLLVLNSADLNAETSVLPVVSRYCRRYRVKSRNISMNSLNMIIELRVKDSSGLIAALSELPCITSVSLLMHDGEAVA